MKHFKPQRGVTLIELMLSLVIIISLILVAIRYYQPVRSAYQVNKGIELTQGFINASNGWFELYRNFQAGQPDKAPSPGISINSLMMLALLPRTFATPNSISPWHGNLTVQAVNATKVEFIFDDVPQKDCYSFKDALTVKGLVLDSPNCNQGANTITATYQVNLQ